MNCVWTMWHKCLICYILVPPFGEDGYYYDSVAYCMKWKNMPCMDIMVYMIKSIVEYVTFGFSWKMESDLWHSLHAILFLWYNYTVLFGVIRRGVTQSTGSHRPTKCISVSPYLLLFLAHLLSLFLYIFCIILFSYFFYQNKIQKKNAFILNN